SEDALTAELEKASPREVLEWVAAKVDELAITTSFQSSGLVLLHLLQSVKPGIPVLFLDTGFHFPETLEFRDRVVDTWGLNLVVLRGEHRSPEHQEEIYGPALYRRRPDQCCTINKVEPLQKALDGFDAWISGLRRDQSRLRSGIPVAETQTLPSGHQILKLHPLAGWTKSDVQAYTDAHHIPSHPLVDKGFASIGCWPCTRPVEQGEEERAGRWDGDDKSECGIHTFGNETRESV
ncbi:MAG: phosphoadenylyl-sulfate reductase, partial [Actinobacteria bacterium]|nr:phosphoadenylyl-sulfate reductase [Actinomycetota bacterium]